MHWLDEHPGPSFANLVDWQRLNISQMTSRIEADRSAKPRIEISAHISKMNNLSVRWHPGGWRYSDIDWGRAGQHSPNLITHRKWNQPTDFRWFVGDEQPTFDARPTNELMYVRRTVRATRPSRSMCRTRWPRSGRKCGAVSAKRSPLRDARGFSRIGYRSAQRELGDSCQGSKARRRKSAALTQAIVDRWHRSPNH